MRLFPIACVGVLAACSGSPSGPSVRQEVPSTIVAGDATTCLLSTGGKAYCWGADSTGLLGIGSAVTAQMAPAAVIGGNTYSALSGAETFRCGLSNGAPWCWGQTLGGLSSQFVFNDTTPTAMSTPGPLATIAAGESDACGLTANGTAYCWGDNYYGQLGAGDTVAHSGVVAVSGGLHFAAISVGFFHTCALTPSGAAYCWGDNSAGELGSAPGSGSQKVSAPQAVGGGLTFGSISAGTLYTCAVTGAGVAYCWGLNAVGNLGDGTDTTRTTPTPVSQSGLTFATVATDGGNRITITTCGITTSGAAYCWGYAGASELGDPSVTANASYTPVPVAGGLTFATLSVGTTHACGVTTSSAAYCWGQNDHGQLGDGTTQSSNVPVAVGGSLTAQLTRRGWR